ncbi:hypothetical protein RMATCC62417_17311 [Rhizopus microsporus]|nr:hypothetical protein RMATCC62417_17311 [Rhizopus microsporus]
MNEANLNLSTKQKLEPFLLLSKSAKGIACCQLIMDALNAPGVFVFTELYESPNIVQASQLPQVIPYYQLLRIFLYGTFKEYQQQKHNLPTLSATQIKKLRQLTLVSLSEHTQTLDYVFLLNELNITTVRELEDLIMDAMYDGLLTGKLDQRQQQLLVTKAIGRDVRPEQLDEMMETLGAWSAQTARTLARLDANIAHLQETVQTNQQAKIDFNRQIEDIRKECRESSNSLPNEVLQEDGRSSRKARDAYNIRKRGPKRFLAEKLNQF